MIRKFFSSINFARLFAVLAVGGIALALWCASRSPLARALARQKPIFAVLSGVDRVKDRPDADLILFLRYDPATRALDALLIPRETQIHLPGGKSKKIHDIYVESYLNREDSVAALLDLKDAAQKLLFVGRASPKVDYVAQIHYNAYQKMAELLGPIPVTVEEPLQELDAAGVLQTRFEAARHWLNSQRILEYARFRGVSSEDARVQRQKNLARAILRRAVYPVNIFKIFKFVAVYRESVKTNLNVMEQFLVFWELKDLQPDRIRWLQLPGKAQRGAWLPDAQALEATVTLLLEPARNARVVAVVNQVAVSTVVGAPQLSSIRAKTTVEVWNASSHRGLALDVARKLRQNGFDVVKWGNYNSRQQKTLVRDRKGNIDQARAIAQVLGSVGVEVFTRLESNPLVDVEVILGEEYGLK